MAESPTLDATPRAVQTRARRPTICVINYNGERFLDACLRSVESEQQDVLEVLLIDNASQDNSIEIVKRDYPQVRIIALKENLGAAAARNVGVREAKADLILLVDNDVELAPGCVRSLTDALQGTPRAAVAMPVVCYAADRKIVQYDGADSHFIGLMALRNENVPIDLVDPEVHEIGSVVSACVLVDRSKYPAVDLFDENFFIYHEDHDFGYRTRALGHSILSVPAARCFHGTGTEALSIRDLGYYSRRRVFYQIRNRWFFLAKNYSLRTLVILAPVLCLYEIAQLILSLKKGWVGVWLNAVGSTVLSIPRTIGLRVQAQRQRQQCDGALVTAGPVPLRAELTASSLEERAKNLLDRSIMAYWRIVGSWL